VWLDCVAGLRSDDEESAVEPQQREAEAAGAAGPDLTTVVMP
jgi:hypothetical protein